MLPVQAVPHIEEGRVKKCVTPCILFKVILPLDPGTAAAFTPRENQSSNLSDLAHCCWGILHIDFPLLQVVIHVFIYIHYRHVDVGSGGGVRSSLE